MPVIKRSPQSSPVRVCFSIYPTRIAASADTFGSRRACIVGFSHAAPLASANNVAHSVFSKPLPQGERS
jgi:hypothetical protein